MKKQKNPYKLTALPAWAATLALLAWLVYDGAVKSGYSWEWSRIPAFFFDADKGELGPLTLGLGLTFQITFWSLLITFGLGLFIALARLAGGTVLSALARIYLEVIRNTPLLVQILVMYSVVGEIFSLSRFWAAVLAVSFFEAAYLSEIIRSGILAVGEGQWQAAWCLGLSTPDTFRRVILPQTGPMLLPPLCSLVISLIKDSALVSVIGVYELTKAARSLIAKTYLALELWLTIAVVYLLINLAVSELGAFLERRLGASGRAGRFL
ncbi:MAG: amino acid ABC transporter permease [Candidatus Adiutrix sp.]|jgi:polar amino acid transport system permease protein|nr:amino acid ABC transporter permease [Candidatus Adiutrix sp.]